MDVCLEGGGGGAFLLPCTGKGRLIFIVYSLLLAWYGWGGFFEIWFWFWMAGGGGGGGSLFDWFCCY